MEKYINIHGAREHNLKDLSLKIPRDSFVVITGLSGSGKSSLAFDTIYAEGQRRYLESLSAYARQFLEQMKRPDVDSIDGLSPSISIEQKSISRNPRSTVGTVTEIYDFLRLLFSRVGTPHCPQCDQPIQSQSVSQIVDSLMKLEQGKRFSILAPVVRQKKVTYEKEFRELRNQGFLRAKIDGRTVELNGTTPLKLKKNFKHDISVYIDRLISKPNIESRLSEAISMATLLAEGLAEIEFIDGTLTQLVSTKFACTQCGISFSELEPRAFSFNSPLGACESCEGLGTQEVFDRSLVVPDPSLSLSAGAIHPWATKSQAWQKKVYEPLAKQFHFSLDTPFEDLSETIQNLILFGSKDQFTYEIESRQGSEKISQRFQGVLPILEKKRETSDPEYWDDEIDPYLTEQPCPDCHGDRLKKEILSVRIAGINISQFCQQNISQCLSFLDALKLTPAQNRIAEPVVKEISSRIKFLQRVGLDYLTLSRSVATLSGGEAQRIRLATQIGSSLVGVLYVLDEPSIGLHQRDNQSLIETLKELRDQGNSVLVVEHDQATIQQSDFVIDLGPGAGHHGGELVYCGSPKKIAASKKSLTGQYLSGAKSIETPKVRRKGSPEKQLTIIGATTHNLKNITVQIPLGTFVVVSGVSGSGKSSLIIDTLLPALAHSLHRVGTRPTTTTRFEGLKALDRIIHVDQAPIGRTPRSNPATYTGIFTHIRTLFASLPEAKMHGYTPSRFSFNVSGGRCEACSGDGALRITMNFLPNVNVLCEVCQGRRYNRETLQVHYRGKSIADVLSLTVEDAYTFFERIPSLRSRFQTLLDVGLGYIQLGQSALTLSGGEAQRIKLSKELNKRATGRTLYILDEPTTGLHFEDIRKLMTILHTLVDQGNTVIVIEHNLDVIKQADHIIELGPEGGERGGRIVFEGTPEKLAGSNLTATSQFLKSVL